MWVVRKMSDERLRQELGEEDGALISAMLLGEKAGLSEEDKNKETKKASKKEEKTEVVEVKEEVVEAKEETVDYTKMTVAELKEVAANKGIEVAGMKKAEIIEALTK